MVSHTPHALALPPNFSPDTLDVLTELADVLQRVHESAREGLTTQPKLPNTNNTTTGSGQTPAGASQPKTGDLSAAGAGGKKGGLTFKDVPGATDGIKHKLQKARSQVRALPDMERSVEEQKAEIEELEGKIERQRALLGRLREGGLAFGKEVADRMET